MTDSTAEFSLTTTVRLLTYYSGEEDNPPHASLLDSWLEHYPPNWVRLALIEALYRGRYKTISVGGLLADWQRRGQPIYHFNREFEALICHNFPKIWFSQDSDLSSSRSSVSLPLASADNAQQPTTTAAPISVDTDISTSPSTSVAHVGAWSSGPDFPGIENSADLVSRTSPEADQFWHQAPGSSPLDDMFALAEPEDADLVFEHPPSMVEPHTECQRQEVAPIHQFTPARTSSGHYQKLVAMVSKQAQPCGQQATPIDSVAS